MPTITVEGENPFEAAAGTKLVLAIEDAGIDILHRCGGQARCTTCRVHFTQGEPSEMGEAERETLGRRRTARRIPIVVPGAHRRRRHGRAGLGPGL